MNEFLLKLLEGGEASLQSLCDKRQQEHVGLEFKTKRTSSHGDFEKDDRANLGRELSAFANSAGGLLIWGIEAKKDADQVDCASSLKPISEIAKFLSQAKELSSQHLMPRHEGIKFHTIPSKTDSKSGYLIVEIDRSDRRPHRSEAASDKRYYKRSADSSIMMEHYDVEDQFKRFVSPKLALKTRWRKGGFSQTRSSYASYIMTASLENTSQVTAEFVYLHFLGVSRSHGGPDSPGVIAITLRGPSIIHLNGWQCFQGGADAVIHPGQDLDTLEVQFVLSISEGKQPLVNGGLWRQSPLRFVARFGCKNAPQQEVNLAVGTHFPLAFIEENLGLPEWFHYP